MRLAIVVTLGLSSCSTFMTDRSIESRAQQCISIAACQMIVDQARETLVNCPDCVLEQRALEVASKQIDMQKAQQAAAANDRAFKAQLAAAAAQAEIDSAAVAKARADADAKEAADLQALERRCAEEQEAASKAAAERARKSSR